MVLPLLRGVLRDGVAGSRVGDSTRIADLTLLGLHLERPPSRSSVDSMRFVIVLRMFSRRSATSAAATITATLRKIT